jgi:TrmH family RNA methyltransferase
LIDDALAARVELIAVLVAERREERALELERRGVRVQRVADELLERVSALTTSLGAIAIARTPAGRALGELALGSDALVLVVAGVADPGNLGALARSAEASGCAALCVVAGGASPWNDKALRGSMGSLLRLPVATFASAELAAAELERLRFRQVTAATRDGVPLKRLDWSGRVALWVGSETGAAPAVCERFERVTIPMRGRVESLNVTVAASLLLFAAGRVD